MKSDHVYVRWKVHHPPTLGSVVAARRSRVEVSRRLKPGAFSAGRTAAALERETSPQRRSARAFETTEERILGICNRLIRLEVRENECGGVVKSEGPRVDEFIYTFSSRRFVRTGKVAHFALASLA